MAKNIEKITIKIEGEEWQKALDKAFKKHVKEVKVDGFRKGSVPKNIYLEKFGIESLYMDAVDNCINDAYQKALKESKINPVIEPKVDIPAIDKDAVTFEITITGKPDVKLGEYKKLKVKKDKVEVSKDEIDHEIEHLREQFAEIRVKEEGKVEDGDTAVIDFKGYVDGKELDGGSGENFPLEIGSHTFIPGFEEGVLGMKVDEEKDLELEFPKDYVKDLAGKKVTFHVTLKEIKTRVLPDIDEDFFKDLGYDKVTNAEELAKEVEEVIKKRKQDEIDDRFIEEVLSKAAENMEPEATKRIKYRYLLEAVAEAEKIEVTDEEADKDAEEMAQNYGISKEELLKAFGNMEVLKYDAKMRKTLEFLKNNN